MELTWDLEVLSLPLTFGIVGGLVWKSSNPVGAAWTRAPWRNVCFPPPYNKSKRVFVVPDLLREEL